MKRTTRVGGCSRGGVDRTQLSYLRPLITRIGITNAYRNCVTCARRANNLVAHGCSSKRIKQRWP